MTIDEVLKFEEKQIFDRKSINIEPKALAIPIIAFANADGGTIAIGVSDRTRRIEGVDFETPKLNELLRVPFDFCVPTVKVEIEDVSCVDSEGRVNHITLMHIEPSMEVHANQADEVYMRVGDKSKKLTFEERTQLMYDKGERFFEDKPVPDADMEDIDMEFVKAYIEKIGYSKTPMEYLKENKGFVKEKKGAIQVSSAAILLFGKNPQLHFPRARVRFIRYEGTEEKFGTEMNVIKDVIFEGNILKMINDAITYLDTQIKEKTYLGQDGKFVTEEEYPKFVRQEIVVNAVTHRDYSIRGTDIQIKLFDDRIVVESPGRLPGLVRADNIRHIHFSRNPKIAEFLKTYSFVKEYGEGVDRMCKELEAAGLHAPEYYSNSFMLQAIVRNSSIVKPEIGYKKPEIGHEKPEIGHKKPEIGSEKLSFDTIKSKIESCKYNEPTVNNILKIYNDIDNNQIFGASDVRKILGCSPSTASEIMAKLRELGVVREVKGKGKGKCRFAYEDE
ncbi:ATP-binding protein [Anaerobium acetethylicum]|nr:ATP-binding protein [Anaerobium acetethylicum]